MGDVRYRKAYDAVATAADRPAALRRLSDEEIVAALAAAAEKSDALLANVLATEAMNRIRRLRASLAHLGEGVVTLDLDLRVGWLNQAAETLLGGPRSELAGRLFPEIVTHLDPTGRPVPREASVVFRALEGQTTAADEDYFETRTGARVCVAITGAPILGPDGAPEGVVLAFRDCTERQRSQMQLRGERERYKSLFDLSPNPIVSVDVSGEIVDTNPATERLTGRPAGEAIGRSFAEFLHPDDAERALGLFTSVIGGRRESASLRVLHANGAFLEVEVTGLPVVVDGEVVAVHGILRPR